MKKMNLKYYLRGLGAGIVVTAIIMCIATDDPKEKLSDAEIKARAAELGMVEGSSGLLSELEKETMTPETVEKTEEIETPKPTKMPEATATPKVVETPKPTEEPKATEKPEETEKNIEKPSPDVIIIEINSGESSHMVCKHLEEKGLITSATDFDKYLCDRGLDKRLRAGSYEIPEDAEQEEIAKILTY